jgi:hypothetical protein
MENPQMKTNLTEVPGGVPTALTRQLLNGEMASWMPDNVNACKHDPSVEVFKWDTLYHESPEWGGTRHYVSTVRVGRVFQQDLPEFSLGDNGSKWANSFQYHSQPLMAGVENLCDWGRSWIAHETRPARVVELLRDAPTFYRHGVNPLPRLRELLPGWKWDYARYWQGKDEFWCADRMPGLRQQVDRNGTKLTHVFEVSGEWHRIDGTVKPFYPTWGDLFDLRHIEIDL